MRVERPYTAELAAPSAELSPRAATSHGVRLPPAPDDAESKPPPPRGQARRGSLGLGLLRARQQARQAALAAKFQENVTPTPVEVGDQREHVRMLLQAIDSGNTIALPEIDAGAMTPAAKQGKAASRRIGDAASSASNISRAYLAGVLQPRREFDETPRWKEEIVERVRRRTAGGSLTERAQLKTAAATPRRRGGSHSARARLTAGTARAPRFGSGSGGDGDGGDSDGDDDGAGARRLSSSSVGSAASSLGRREPKFGTNARLAAWKREANERARYIHGDQLGDLVLEAQFVGDEIAELTAKVKALEEEQTANAGRKGRLSLVGAAPGHAAIVQRDALFDRVEVLESRTSEMEKANTKLAHVIDMLRIERRDVVLKVRASEGREKTMGSEMAGFSSVAHAALDEREKVETKRKELREKKRREEEAHAKVVARLKADEDELDAAIAAAHAQEEVAPRSWRCALYWHSAASRGGVARPRTRWARLPTSRRCWRRSRRWAAGPEEEEKTLAHRTP